MNFQELHNITNNFCDAHSFVTFGEPAFDYDHQCYNYDVRSTFYNSLCNAAVENEKLANILVRLTKKENLNNKGKLTVHVLRILESLLEKHEHFEDEYICQSNRAKSHEELQSLHMNYNTVTRDVKRMIKQCYSLIEDLENGNIREDFETEQEYLQCVQEVMKENEEDAAKFEALIADSLAKIKQQLSELYTEAKNMKFAS